MSFFSGLELNFAGHRHSRTDVAYPCTTHTHTHTHIHILPANCFYLNILFEYFFRIMYSCDVKAEFSAAITPVLSVLLLLLLSSSMLNSLKKSIFLPSPIAPYTKMILFPSRAEIYRARDKCLMGGSSLPWVQWVGCTKLGPLTTALFPSWFYQ